VSKWRAKYDECNKKNEQLLLTIQKLENKNKTLETEFNSKNDDCQQKEVSIKKLKNTNKVLQETCAQIERQAEQFRAKYEGLGEQKQKLLVDKNDTVSEVHKLNKELEIIKNKLKSELEDKQEAYKLLESEQVEYENLIKAEKQKLADLKQNFEKECQKTREYEDKTSVQERNLYSSDETIRMLESTNNQLEEELIAIKEEAAKHITTIASLKESKHKLTIALEKSMQKAESLQDRIDKLHNEFDVKEEELNRERITTQETINQQLKLIDFLQNKIESLEKQKKVKTR
jgi:chromosome segregation protein